MFIRCIELVYSDRLMSKVLIGELGLVLRRWDFLFAISQSDGVSPSKLSSPLGKTPQEISRWCKELGDMRLITLEAAQAGYKVCRLTSRGSMVIDRVRNLLVSLELASPSLIDPRPEYWTDLKVKLYSRNELVVRAAYKDLQNLCRTSKVWMLGEDLWGFLGGELDKHDNQYMDELITCISFTQAHAVGQGLGEIATEVKNRFSEMLRKIVLQGEPAVRIEAMSCLRAMLSEDELAALVKDGFREAFRLEDEEAYRSQLSVLSEPFKMLYQKHGEDLRKWLYEEMEEPQGAQRAYELYRIIQNSI
jgi:DNA-binding MarR family transcriptional regulator